MSACESIAVRICGDGLVVIFDDGGRGAGRFFRLPAMYELALLVVDNAGEEVDRKVTFS